METNAETLKNNAQQAARDAVASASATADQVREKGTQFLNNTLSTAKDAQDKMLAASKDALSTTDGYVKENPWAAAMIFAGVGLVAGMLLGKR